MSIPGFMHSHSMRKNFAIFSGLLILILLILTILVYKTYVDPKNLPFWEAILDVLISFLTSALFAVFCAFYITYVFIDPEKLNASVILAPSDISRALKETATQATEYFIFVRTGRYFREEIAPLLGNISRENRNGLRIDAVLLDFRDEKTCQTYADYRSQNHFDATQWNLEYVQVEVVKTILRLLELKDTYTLLDINIYLTSRLSTFRIEGSGDSIIVTREDPKEIAYRYIKKFEATRYFAYRQEFDWTKLSSERIDLNRFFELSDSRDLSNSSLASTSEIISKAREILKKEIDTTSTT